jgi:hypothetical protein
LGEDFLADGALDQNPAPAIRAAVLKRPKKRSAMMRASLHRERGWVDREGVVALEPVKRILE